VGVNAWGERGGVFLGEAPDEKTLENRSTSNQGGPLNIIGEGNWHRNSALIVNHPGRGQEKRVKARMLGSKVTPAARETGTKDTGTVFKEEGTAVNTGRKRRKQHTKRGRFLAKGVQHVPGEKNTYLGQVKYSDTLAL